MKSPWIAIVAIAACGGDSATTRPAHVGEALEVVFAGSGGLRNVRYHPTKGTSTPLALAIDVDVDASGKGGPLPTLAIQSVLTIEDVLPDGALRVRATIDEIAGTERPDSTISAAAMTEHTQLLRGISLVGTIAPDGIIRELRADNSGDKLPLALRQQLETLSKSFEQIAVPLPTVPVGSGAAWRQRRTIEQNGMKLSSITSFVVTSLDENHISFTSSTSLTGADQTVTMGGIAIQVSNIGGSGTGKGTIDLTRMTLAGETTLAVHSDMTAEGTTDRMSMKMATRIGPGTPRDPRTPANPAVAPPALPNDQPEDLGAPDNTEASGENEPVAP